MSKALLFFHQVIEEGKKIVWPTRKEVILTSIVVLIFALIFGLFLAFVDEIIIGVLQLILRFNHA